MSYGLERNVAVFPAVPVAPATNVADEFHTAVEHNGTIVWAKTSNGLISSK